MAKMHFGERKPITAGAHHGHHWSPANFSLRNPGGAGKDVNLLNSYQHFDLWADLRFSYYSDKTPDDLVFVSRQNHMQSPSLTASTSVAASKLADRPAGKLAIAAAILWTLWFALGSPRLWDRDEPRNARCAVEMLERNDWVVPMFNDELRTHKPILLYWMQMSSYALFGINEFAARFGSALCGTLVCIAVYWFAKRHGSAEYAWWSALAMSSCFMFVVASRAATPDAVLLATSSIGLFFIASSQIRLKDQAQTNRYWLLGYCCLGLAVLAKGPVGVVIPLAVLGIWQFFRNWSLTSSDLSQMKVEQVSLFKALSQVIRNPKTWGRWLLSLIQHAISVGWTSFRDLRMGVGLLIVLTIAIPWYVWVGMRTDGAWLYGFFVEHNVQRAVSSMEGHSGGVWFYPVAILLGVFPWSLLLIPILVWTSKHIRGDQRSPLVQLGLIWVAVTITAFSCASTKLPSYITTCYPGAALLIGGTLLDLYASSYVLGRKLAVVAGSVMGLVCISLTIGIVAASLYLSMPLLMLCVVGPIFLLWPAWSFFQLHATFDSGAVRQSHVLHRFAFASVALVGVLLGIGPAIISLYRSDLNQLLAVSKSTSSSAQWMSVGTLEPSWVFYLGQPIREVARFDHNAFADGNWGQVAIDHLMQNNGRVILSKPDADALQQHWQSEASAKTEDFTLVVDTEFHRLFESETSVVLRAIPRSGSTRFAKSTHTSEESSSSPNLKR